MTEEYEFDTVTLELDDNQEQECEVIGIYEAGGRKYIALLPLDENGENEDGDVWLYRYEDEDGEPTLANIESDEEQEIAAEGFDEFLDAGEFDELIDGEDL